MEQSLAITPALTPPSGQSATLQTGRLRLGSKERSIVVLTHIAKGVALPLVSPFIFIANLISFCIHAGKFCFHAAKSSSLSSSKKVTSLQPPADPQTRVLQTQQALQTLGNGISENEGKRQKALRDLKDNCHAFVLSLLGMIPFLGLLGSQAYAQKIEGEESHGYATAALLYRLAKPFIPAPLDRDSLFFWGKTLAGFSGSRSEVQEQKEWVLSPKSEMTPPVLYKQGPSIIATEIPVERGDGKGHAIFCHTAKTLNQNSSNKTMVLFPGMLLEGTTLTEAAAFYAKQGWNVLMVTLGGLYGNDPEVNTSEITAIQDVAAVLQYLDREGVKTIGVHGFSLGCALAMHATQLSSKVKVAVLDKPFTTLPDTAVHSLRNVADHLQADIENDERLKGIISDQLLSDQARTLVCREHLELMDSLNTDDGKEHFRKAHLQKFFELKELASHAHGPSQDISRKRLGLHALASLLPRWVIRRAVEEALPPRQSVPAVRDKENRPYHTDNFDNKAKVARFTGSLVVIGGEHDELMSYTRPGEERSRTCSDDLIEASLSSHCIHTQTDQRHSCILTQEGEEAIQHGLDALVEPSSPPPAR